MRALPILSLSLLLLLAGPVRATDIPDPFSQSPAELRDAAANPEHEGENAWYLYYSDGTQLEADGRRHVWHHEIYLLRSPEEGPGWDEVEVTWNPGYQERPVLRARVINEDGTEHWLDGDTLSDQPIGSYLPEVYSDRRSLAAPLPFVRPGSIVEVHWMIRSARPWFDGGVADRQLVSRFNPIDDRRIIYEVHGDLPFRWKYQRGEGVEPLVTRDGEWTTWDFRFGALESGEWKDLYSIDDGHGALMLLTSSAESWNAVARAYGRIVEEALAGHVLNDEVRDLIDGGGSETEVLRRVAGHVRSSIRYTGLHFGDAGLVPYSPREVDRRGFGDCKDQATYLVAALRAAGMDANVAVLLTGPDLRLDPEMPGLGVFDHAIVHVRGEREYWIDPTFDRAPALQIPAANQGRYALIIADDTTGLVEIPVSSADENRNHEVRTIRIAEYGPASVVEESYPEGFDAAAYRDSWMSSGDGEYVKSLQRYAKAHYVSEAEPRVTLDGFGDLEGDLSIRIEVDSASVAYSDFSEAFAFLTTEPVFGDLSLEEFEEDRPLLYMVPFVNVFEYRVEYPASFSLTEELESSEERFGAATIRFDVDQPDATRIDIRIECRVDSVAIAAGDAARLVEWAESRPWSETIDLYFTNPGEAALAAGEYAAAHAAFGAELERDPESILGHARMSRLYLALGLGEAALDQAKAAVDLDDESALAHRALGNVYRHDPLGRENSPGFRRDDALEEYMRSLELDPSDDETRAYYSDLLAIGEDGRVGGEGSDLAAAYEELLIVRENLGNFELDTITIGYLIRLGEPGKILEFVEEQETGELTELVGRLAHAALTGGNPGRVLTGNRSSEAVQAALGTTSTLLMQQRCYPEAASLYKLFARRLDNPGQRMAVNQLADMLGKAQRIEDRLASEEDAPHTPLLRLFRSFQTEAWGQEVRESIFVDDGIYDYGEENPFAGLSRVLVNSTSQASFGLLNEAEPILDLSAAISDWVVEGDDETGWTVDLETEGQPMGLTIRTVLTPDGYRATGPDLATGVAWHALRLIDDDRDELVATMFDQVAERRDELRLPDVAPGRFFDLLWAREKEKESPDLEACAWALALNGPSRKAGRFVEKYLERDEQAGDAGLLQAGYADLAFCGVQLEDRKLQVRALEALSEVPDRPAELDEMLIALLLENEALDEAEPIIRARREAEPDDRRWMRLEADHYGTGGRFAEAVAAMEASLATGDQEEGDLNQLVWYAICGGTVSADQVALMEEEWIDDPGRLHTLALAHACLGNVDESRQIAIHAIDVGGAAPDDPDYLLVSARIAQALGEADIAKEAYQLVLEHAGDDFRAHESPSLAREWLKELR